VVFAVDSWAELKYPDITASVTNLFGQTIGKGFLPDVHCPTGAPREAIVKISKAEPGGIGGKGLWRPAALGLRPGYESEAMKRYLAGEFVPPGSDQSGSKGGKA
jgi:nitrate reductase alpha subunit